MRRWQDTFGEHSINWAVATGAPSGIVVVDVDPRNGGGESLVQLELPETLTALTGGGGYHFFFRYDGALGNRQNLLRGIDFKADGGYVILHPGRHASGGQYTWRDPETPVADLPEHIAEMLRTGAAGSSTAPSALDDSGPIRTGERNETLFRLACRYRRQLRDDRLAVEGAVRAANAVRCVEPLSDDEVGRIIDSAFRQDHDDDALVAAADELVKLRGLDDNGNAYRLVDRHGEDIRFVGFAKQWVTWDGTRFAPDNEQRIVQRARETAEHIAEDAALVPDDHKSRVLRWAATSLSAAKISAMVSLARADERVLVTSPSVFDADPDLLNTPDGVVDLRTGQLRQHDRSLMMSKVTGVGYDPTADVGPWVRFLRWAMCGRDDLVSFLQELFGYAATGHTSEQVLALFVGQGANGKSTCQTVVRRVLGDYAMQAEPDLLTGVEGAHPTGVADLRGRRLVIASETREGRKFDERTVKQLTGGDAITARKLYQDFVEFEPTHTIIFAANHRPVVTDDSHAMWRRLLVVPWDATVADDQKIGDLVERFMFHHGPAILAWVVEGARRWYERGRLLVPDEVRRQVQEYRDDQDELGEFIAARLDQCVECFEASESVYSAYVAWCEEQLLPRAARLSRKALITRLGSRPGITPHRSAHSDGKRRGLRGVAVRQVRGWNGGL